MAVFVYCPSKKFVHDSYQYLCFAFCEDLTEYNLPAKVPIEKIQRTEDRETLQQLGVSELPALLKIYAYNNNNLQGHFGMVFLKKINEADSFAVGHFVNSVNQLKTEQRFAERAVYIKTIHNYQLYYLGARLREDGQAHVVRLYVPTTNTASYRHHIDIIRQLQSVLSEKEFKDLKETLNLRVTPHGITVSFYHAQTENIVTATFDFFRKRHNTCMDFNRSNLWRDPVGFLLSLYYSTKAWQSGDLETMTAVSTPSTAHLR